MPLSIMARATRMPWGVAVALTPVSRRWRSSSAGELNVRVWLSVMILARTPALSNTARHASADIDPGGGVTNSRSSGKLSAA